MQILTESELVGEINAIVTVTFPRKMIFAFIASELVEMEKYTLNIEYKSKNILSKVGYLTCRNIYVNAKFFYIFYATVLCFLCENRIYSNYVVYKSKIICILKYFLYN